MIKFQGPYHISQLNHLSLNGKKGVYIWGFAFKFQNENCVEPVNFYGGDCLADFGDNEILFADKIKFIPYYVGQTNDLNDRIRTHSNFRKGDARKFTRFSISYMNNFFSGNGYPVNYKMANSINRLNNIILFHRTNPNCLEYYNSKVVLMSIYPGTTPIGNGNHWPINNQHNLHGNPLSDTLDILRMRYNNFFFCYAENLDNLNLEDAEVSTFWALKGFTISQIKNGHTQISVSGSPACSYLFRTPPGVPCSLATTAVFPGNY